MASFVAFFFFFFFFLGRVGWGWRGRGLVCSLKKIFLGGFVLFLFFDGKSVMPMFCNAMLLLLYVHVCVTRTGWKTRPRTKTVILLIKQSINQSINTDLIHKSMGEMSSPEVGSVQKTSSVACCNDDTITTQHIQSLSR